MKMKRYFVITLLWIIVFTFDACTIIGATGGALIDHSEEVRQSASDSLPVSLLPGDKITVNLTTGNRVRGYYARIDSFFTDDEKTTLTRVLVLDRGDYTVSISLKEIETVVKTAKPVAVYWGPGIGLALDITAIYIIGTSFHLEAR